MKIKQLCLGFLSIQTYLRFDFAKLFNKQYFRIQLALHFGSRKENKRSWKGRQQDISRRQFPQRVAHAL